MTEKTFFLPLIFTVSCLNNFLIPLAIYTSKYGLFKKRPAGFVGCNGWGLIMDGLLAGLINATALNFLLEIQPKILAADIKIAFWSGLAAMVGAHVFMSVRKWPVWIMPRPWHWNMAGYWHMTSMTLQMSFLFYPLVVILRNPTLLSSRITILTLTLASFSAVLFLVLLYLSSRNGLRVGRIRIGTEAW